MTIRSCLRSATLSPLVSPWGRVPTVSAQTYCVGPSASPVYDPLTFRRAAGPGRGPGRPQCRQRANCDGCAYLRHASQCVTGLRGRLPTVCFGNCVNLRRPPFRDALLPRRAAGPERPQFRPMANCDGCAYLRTVTHSLLAGPRGRAPTVSAKG